MWRKRSKLEQRIRDIERERDRLSRDIKLLDRSRSKRGAASGLLHMPSDSRSLSEDGGRPLLDDTGRGPVGRFIETPAGGGRSARRPSPEPWNPYASGTPRSNEGAPRLRKERNVQRNKAIFMIVFVILVALILFRFLY